MGKNRLPLHHDQSEKTLSDCAGCAGSIIAVNLPQMTQNSVSSTALDSRSLISYRDI